jgi:CubicO group peptidase (beta-lactamase class C family)
MEHRRPSLIVVGLLVALSVVGNRQAAGLSKDKADTSIQRVADFMKTLHSRNQFNGAILVADSHGVIYQQAFGLADKASKASFTLDTESCLASVSKPFTALAVLTLVQRGLIKLDDPISKYVNGLHPELGAVTLRELLSHTSGVPDYSDLNIEHPEMTSVEVIDALRKVDHLQFPAGEKYEYSNSGYVLLGAAVERVTGLSLPGYLQRTILDPVGMKNTFVFTQESQKTSRVAKAYNTFGDLDDYDSFVVGDGGMYSTVGDLYRFDRALYRSHLISSRLLDEAYTPETVRVGHTAYGLGWNIEKTLGGTRVWHTGSTSGFRAYFERQLKEHRAIIMLTNVGNSRRVEIAAAINHILDGQPFTYPQQSSAAELHKVFLTSGIDAVIAKYQALKAAKTNDFDLSEAELNMLGYQVLYGDRKPNDAVRIFTLNAQEHSSSNAFDSLAEAYKVSGNIAAARDNYEKAVQLDPENVHAKTALSVMQHR